MAHAKLPQNHAANPTSESELDRDYAIASLIAGMNYLCSQAQLSGLGTAARILSTAKEDLVHWAVDMNFHESARDRFINSQLYGPLGSGVPALMEHMHTPDAAKPHALHKKSSPDHM